MKTRTILNHIIIAIGILMLIFTLVHNPVHAEETAQEEVYEEVYEEEITSWVESWVEDYQPIAQKVWDEYVGNPELLDEEAYLILDNIVFQEIWIIENSQ